MKTNPWQKQTKRAATFERCLNSLRGMTGYRASFHSLTTKRQATTKPKIIKQRTVGEVQGYVTPPNSRPKSTMSVPPTMVREPAQSTALRPSQTGVLGLWRCRKKESAMITVPVIGTTIC